MAAPILPLAYPPCIAKGEVLHNAGEGSVSHLQRQVNRVRHEAEGMSSVAKPHYSLLDKKIEAVAVFVIEEDVLPGVASHDNVV